MDDGIRGSPLSKSKVINLESEGSTAPKVDKKALRYEGQVLRTFRVDMVEGDWAKSSKIL